MTRKISLIALGAVLIMAMLACSSGSSSTDTGTSDVAATADALAATQAALEAAAEEPAEQAPAEEPAQPAAGEQAPEQTLPGEVILYSQFTDPDDPNFYLGYTEEWGATTAVENGMLTIDFDQSGFYFYVDPALPAVSYTDMIVETRAKVDMGGVNASTMAMCRVTDEASYNVLVWNDGYYVIERFNNDEYTWISQGGEAQQSSLLKDGWNTYALSCIGDQISFYVDGTLVETVTDTAVTAGVAAVAVSSDTEETYTKGSFEYMIVTVP